MDAENNSLDEWFAAYHDAIKKRCMRYFHYLPQYMPEVDDCVQEVFLAACRKWDQLQHHENLYAWLTDACQKQCLSVMRRDGRRQEIVGRGVPYDEQAGVPSLGNDIEYWVEQMDRQAKLDLLFSRLTEQERRVYADYFEADKPVRQIADERRCTEVSVRGAIQRIRLKAQKVQGDKKFCER